MLTGHAVSKHRTRGSSLPGRAKTWDFSNTQSTRREVRAMSEIRGSVLADGGVRLSYKSAAEGSHNLLLMHGWAGSANSWDGVVKALDLPRFRTIAGHFRGHRDSDKAPPLFSQTNGSPRMRWQSPTPQACGRLTAVGFSVSCRFIQTCRCRPVACGSYGNRCRLSGVPIELPDALMPTGCREPAIAAGCARSLCVDSVPAIDGGSDTGDRDSDPGRSLGPAVWVP